MKGIYHLDQLIRKIELYNHKTGSTTYFESGDELTGYIGKIETNTFKYEGQMDNHGIPHGYGSKIISGVK
jgi:hypothetical protein